jgi:acyl dehydratase
MRHFEHLHDLQALVGKEIGVSEWIAVEQQRIDQFAQATGDHQWIHVDPVRAASGPFGKTIAHGFLTLSLVPEMFATAFDIGDVHMGVNYGLNRVRFTAPVPSGSRVRGHFVLKSYEPSKVARSWRWRCASSWKARPSPPAWPRRCPAASSERIR